MSKHTPGPWRVDYNETIKAAFIVSDNPTYKVISYKVAGDSDVEIEEMKANAALQATAPELLEKLKECYMILYGGNSVSFADAVARGSTDDEFGQSITNLIKKATC